MWYVYFPELSNCDVFGSTDDLRRRVTSHNDGHVVSTKAYLPASLEPTLPSRRRLSPCLLSDISNRARAIRKLQVRPRNGDSNLAGKV